jgi:Fe-S-cluster containining protein
MSKDDWVTGKVSLTVNGRALEMQMTVPAKPVKPHQMLPIFQQMANALVDVSVEAVEAEGKKKSCKAGCGACCRQPVPIAETEIYQIAELVEAMDEPRRSEIKRRFAEAVEHFQKLNWFERMRDLVESSKTQTREEAAKELEKAAMQYFYEGIPCPFLENESCSIHEARPLACREYLVTSPSENCSNPSAATVKKIDLLIEPSRTLRRFVRTQNFVKLGFLPLIRALEVAEKFPESFVEKTGEQWMADFFQNLTRREIPEKRDSPSQLSRTSL